MPSPRRARPTPKGLADALDLLQRLMRGQTLTVSEAMRGRNVERAAVKGWLDAIADAFPKRVKVEGGGRGATLRYAWVNDPTGHKSAAWALAAARALLSAVRDGEIGVVIGDLHADALTKLAPDAPARSSFDRQFYVANRSGSPLTGHADVLDKVALAIHERRKIRATYTHFNGSRQQVGLEPYTLIFVEEGPYLCARCFESTKAEHVNQTRMFNLGRLADVRLDRGNDGRFAYPLREDYDPAVLLHDCFSVMVPDPRVNTPADVDLRVDRALASYIAMTPVHHSQQVQSTENDGTLRVRLRLHVTYDLVRWIRGHGRCIAVDGPANLRDWVQSGDGGEGYQTYVLDQAASTPASPNDPNGRLARAPRRR
jgi:predicted DNA-binding transcriptional regulator YafY